MRSLRTKVGRIEAARRQVSVKSKAHHHRLMQLINGSLVREQLGIDRVRPEHTDPETYRDIQETLAWARGDYAEAERLRELDPNKHVPPPPGTPWEEQMRMAREALDRTFEDPCDKTESVRAAIASATREFAPLA